VSTERCVVYGIENESIGSGDSTQRPYIIEPGEVYVRFVRSLLMWFFVLVVKSIFANNSI